MDHLNPLWLDKPFLNQVLQQIEKNTLSINVLTWNCKLAVPPGNNYLSYLYRISINYEIEEDPKSVAIIVKVPLESGAYREIADFLDAYVREVRMYKEVLPRMEELHSWRVAAKSFLCPLENYLVLEDLEEQGYKMADRLKQLDLAHCRQVFLSLSRLHALSVAVYYTHPDLILSVGEQVFFREDRVDKHTEKRFLERHLSSMINVIKTVTGCEGYVEIINSKMDNIYNKLVESQKSCEGINVLIHADIWTTNIMFKYSNAGEVIDAKLVDFQTCRFASFANDIIYFWLTSANEEVREHHKEEMFELYRNSLNKALEELKCYERLSKEEFDHQLKTCAPISLNIIAALLPNMMADPEDLLDFNNITLADLAKPQDMDSHFLKNYRSKYYKTILPKVLQNAEAIGAFL